MGRSTIYIVSEDQEFVASAQRFAEATGTTCKCFTPDEWAKEHGNMDASVLPSLASGSNVTGGKVIPFPSGGSDAIATMNHMESQAIKNAINVFKGNLTEAAKALGIGRATLYRKVKLYNIDPSKARRRRAA